MLERLTPHPLAMFAQPIRLTNPARTQVPHAFISCTITAELAPSFVARVRADPSWRYVEIPFDHLAPSRLPATPQRHCWR